MPRPAPLQRVYNNIFFSASQADKVNKVKGKKAVKIMLNAKSEEDIVNFTELGASVILTPYLDEIAQSLAKKLGVL